AFPRQGQPRQPRLRQARRKMANGGKLPDHPAGRSRQNDLESPVMTRRNTPRISFIGFGEAGQAIASGLRETGIERVAAWDILFPEQTGKKLKEAAESLGVRVASSARDAVCETDMIISAVTAASSVDAARSVASDLTGN